MINDKDYKNIIKTGDFDSDKYPACFVVYRLACDKYIKYNSDIYQKYNKIIEE